MNNAFRDTSDVVQANRHVSEQLFRSGNPAHATQALESFVDLGLSDQQIARYFGTSETKVVSLRRFYGLN